MGCVKCGCCGVERGAAVSVGTVERKDGLQCGCFGEERWAAVIVGAVERRDGPQRACCWEISPPRRGIGPQITCFPAHRLFKFRQK